MIAAFIVTVCIWGLILLWTLVKAAGDADNRLEELYQAFLLGEEPNDGNSSEKVQQTT